jgi:hypothetical protein
MLVGDIPMVNKGQALTKNEAENKPIPILELEHTDVVVLFFPLFSIPLTED